MALAWAVWSFESDVTLFETTVDAVVEADPPPYRLEAAVEGRVVAVAASLGDKVEKGQVLFELDTALLSQQHEGLTRLKIALEMQEQAVRQERQAVEQQSELGKQEAMARTAELAALRRELEAKAQIAQKESEALSKPSMSDALPKLDQERAVAKVEETSAAVSVIEHRLDASTKEQGIRDTEIVGRLYRLDRNAGEIRETLEETNAEIARLETEISLRTIRAQTNGRIVAIERMAQDAHIELGQWLVTIVPESSLSIVARIPASRANRVRSGAPCRFAVDGYPWIEFGKVDCVVRAVSGDRSDDGTVTLDVDIVSDNAAIALRHGMTGVVEIESETVSPARLVLRSAGLIGSNS